MTAPAATVRVLIRHDDKWEVYVCGAEYRGNTVKKRKRKKMNNDTDISVYSTYISARKEGCVAVSKTVIYLFTEGYNYKGKKILLWGLF